MLLVLHWASRAQFRTHPDHHYRWIPSCGLDNLHPARVSSESADWLRLYLPDEAGRLQALLSGHVAAIGVFFWWEDTLLERV